MHPAGVANWWSVKMKPKFEKFDMIKAVAHDQVVGYAYAFGALAFVAMLTFGSFLQARPF